MHCVVPVFICETRAMIHLVWACQWTFGMFVLSELGHTCFLAVHSHVVMTQPSGHWGPVLSSAAPASSFCSLLVCVNMRFISSYSTCCVGNRFTAVRGAQEEEEVCLQLEGVRVGPRRACCTHAHFIWLSCSHWDRQPSKKVSVFFSNI